MHSHAWARSENARSARFRSCVRRLHGGGRHTARARDAAGDRASYRPAYVGDAAGGQYRAVRRLRRRILGHDDCGIARLALRRYAFRQIFRAIKVNAVMEMTAISRNTTVSSKTIPAN